MAALEFRAATPELAREYWGGDPRFSFHGWAALIDGRVVGIGGVSYVSGFPVAFSEGKPELMSRKKDVVRCFQFLEEWLGGWTGRLYAECALPTSPRILERLGFREIDMTLGKLRLWVRDEA